MLVNGIDIIKKANQKGYALPAYNINNLEWTKYILEACNVDNIPVILAASPSAINYMGGYKVVYNLVTSLIEDLKIKIPVILHLDHGKSFEECKKAIDNGFTSVMIDLSDKPFEKNVEITKKVVKYAKDKKVSVEAELGSLDGYTNIDECLAFVSETGVDVLAPAVGNKHGIYKKSDNIDFKLLASIAKIVKIPLALHGASGLDENKIKTAIFCGVSKININTDLQLIWSKSVRKYLNDNKDEYDPRRIIGAAEGMIKSMVHYKNELFSSKDKTF